MNKVSYNSYYTEQNVEVYGPGFTQLESLQNLDSGMFSSCHDWEKKDELIMK